MKQPRAVQLNRRLGGFDHLAQRALRVAELLGVIRRHSIDKQVGAHLADQVFELDGSGLDERDLEPMDVEIRQAGTRENARGAVLDGMDVSHDKIPQAYGPDEDERLLDTSDGLF